MILQSTSASFDFSQNSAPVIFTGKVNAFSNPSHGNFRYFQLSRWGRRKLISNFSHKNFRRKLSFCACSVPSDGRNRGLSAEITKGAKGVVIKRLYNGLDGEVLPNESQDSSIQLGSNLTNFQEDPIVDKLRTQLGVIHPIPSPPINRGVAGLFVLFFFIGVVFDKIWTRRKGNKFSERNRRPGEVKPQVPASFSLFLEQDLQRKESVEWVNMVLVKLWKVYREGIENWIIGLLQPVIDDLKKPDYVERVEIKQFSLGDEPLSVRNVERRTSRRVNDLQ